MTDLALVAAVLAVAVGGGLLLRRRGGHVVAPAGAPALDAGTRALVAARLAHRWRGAVLLQVTAPGCATCVAARRVLDEVAAGAGAAVLAIDAAEVPVLVSQQRILRAPTTLVLDGVRVRGRVAGVPDAAQLRELVGRLL